MAVGKRFNRWIETVERKGRKNYPVPREVTLRPASQKFRKPRKNKRNERKERGSNHLPGQEDSRNDPRRFLPRAQRGDQANRPFLFKEGRREKR